MFANQIFNKELVLKYILKILNLLSNNNNQKIPGHEQKFHRSRYIRVKNKHMKRYPNLLTVRAVQIKTTRRYDY